MYLDTCSTVLLLVSDFHCTQVFLYQICLELGRGLTAGQDGRHYVRLCLARGRLSVYCLIRRCWRVQAWRALLRGAPGLPPAARERRSDRSSCEETRAGLLAAALARAERRAGGRTWRPAAASGGVWPGTELRRVQSGRADVEVRGRSRRCVTGCGAAPRGHSATWSCHRPTTRLVMVALSWRSH
ncbi:hypothetical protein NDU88_004859 [Pleurodeles waltl]|uniref:Uncharacterized protein n=1 Tax=Pleurodeles waltl TaxID=8319 RepID=A0AAV7TTT9_PLEWA|nr:hypothetical protein NDU88_004859 [Pleurodeles waltl]